MVMSACVYAWGEWLHAIYLSVGGQCLFCTSLLICVDTLQGHAATIQGWHLIKESRNYKLPDDFAWTAGIRLFIA